MRSTIIDVVIDERKQFNQMDEFRMVRQATPKILQNAVTQRVFRNYILSSEPFRIENLIN